MSFTTATGGPILSVEQISALVVRPLSQASVALRISTVVPIDTGSLRVPVVTADPAAAWVAEGGEITASDPTIAEIDIVPKKLAALTVISSELANDTSPAAQQVVGDGIVRDLQRKIDAAYFGNTTSNGPSGLLSIAANAISGGVVANGFKDLDWAESARTNAEQHNTVVSAFVASPNTVLALSNIKEYTTAGSNKHLLGSDPTQPGQRVVSGVPLLSSPAIADNVIWAVPQSRSLVALRQNVDLRPDSSVFFTSDRIAIRATLRLSWAFTDAAAFSKVTLT